MKRILPLLQALLAVAAIVCGCYIGSALAQTQPSTRPATAPTSQPTTAAVNTLPIFISGLYDPGDASKGDNLNAYIKRYFHDKYNIDLAMSVYDREAEIKSLLPPSGTIVLVGHSWGADECVSITKAYPNRVFKLVLLDPVPNHNPTFDLPDGVLWAWCTWRTTRSDGKTPITAYFSKPINSAKWPFKNVHYVPKFVADKDGGQGAEHGEKVWSGDTGAAVKAAMN